jgi:hypothetical protein
MQGLVVQDICGRPCCTNQHCTDPGADLLTRMLLHLLSIVHVTFAEWLNATSRVTMSHLLHSCILLCAQKHPWFRHGLPQNLEVDTYNGHYVKLSKQAADNAGDEPCTLTACPPSCHPYTCSCVYPASPSCIAPPHLPRRQCAELAERCAQQAEHHLTLLSCCMQMQFAELCARH